MSNVTLTLSVSDVLENITYTEAARWYGEDLLDCFHTDTLISWAGGIDEILGDVSDERIDEEFQSRHPNPSEMLDFIDDEAIIDYLINKGFNIEM